MRAPACLVTPSQLPWAIGTFSAHLAPMHVTDLTMVVEDLCPPAPLTSRECEGAGQVELGTGRADRLGHGWGVDRAQRSPVSTPGVGGLGGPVRRRVGTGTANGRAVPGWARSSRPAPERVEGLESRCRRVQPGRAAGGGSSSGPGTPERVASRKLG